MMLISSPMRACAVAVSVVAATALSGLVGCANTGSVGATVSSTVDSLGHMVTPYKVDVLQGNVVTREQVQALQVGMPREQVRAILGTPLLASLFHADRWDYVFTFRRQGQEPQQRKVTVFFTADAMARVQADELPTESEFVSSLDVRRKGAKVPPLEATEEQLKAFDAQNKTPIRGAESVVPAAAPSTSYPPLESR